jgi:hypothetical protein
MRKLVIAAVLLAVAAILLWRLADSRVPAFQPQTVQLTNGGTLRLDHVTYGTNHEQIVGTKLGRLALHLPKSLCNTLNLQRAAVLDIGQTTNGPTLVFWLQCEGAEIPMHELLVGIADESGYETPATGYQAWGTGNRSPTTNQTIYAGATAFPRRGRELELRVYRQSPSQKLMRLASFRVPNPAPGKVPRWNPERLPIRREADGLKATLVKWRPSTRPTAALNPNLSDEEQCTTAVFDLGDSGAWEPVRVQWQDATGNRAEDTARMAVPEGKGLKVYYRPALWTNEGAWKFRAGFARTSKGPFASNELWVLKNVRVPGTNEFLRSNEEVRLQGASLRLEAVVGPRTADGPILPYIGRVVVVKLLEADEPIRLHLLSVKDNQGRPVPLATKRDSGTADRWDFGIDVPADATALDFTFAIHRIRWLEFLVPTVPESQ